MTTSVATFICSRCREVKPSTDYYWSRGQRGYQCKECQKARTAEYNERDPERRRVSARRSRFRKILRSHGLTESQFDSMVLRQEGRCAVCLDPSPRLEIDHDHVSGRVRGLLCPECNKALGLFYDRVEILQGAIAYLLDGDEMGWCHTCGLWQRRSEARHGSLAWAKGLPEESRVVQKCAAGCDEAWPDNGTIAGIFTVATSTLDPACAERHADDHLVDPGGCGCRRRAALTPG